MNILLLVLSFMKIGAFSFGGGYAMIPFFEREIAAHHWAAAADYKKVIAIAQLLPGPFAIDSSTYIGYKVAGIGGALLASAALSLPAFLALILISKYYNRFKEDRQIQSALRGVRPVVIALLISAAFIIGIKPLAPDWEALISFKTIKGLVLATVGYFILKRTKINPIVFILLFAVIGMVIF